MVELVAAVAFLLLAWLLVLAGWRNRRIEGNGAAFLMSTLMFGTIGVYSLARQQLDGALVLVLIVVVFVQFLFAKYMLRVFADDRPPSA